ncbi:MAG: hypothetical protein A2Z83_04560 [Omnitrophica bacterium GWA2_52_8]|nr:MAG: hypothetical protein A2Z83_04560 [Omnitrophica bacterium GWA2_52_8]
MTDKSKDLLRRKLKQEIAVRKGVEKKLIKSGQHYNCLLEQSRNMQEHLRHLSRQIIQAQEEERKEISRELHDEIAQTLSGINAHLATLKVEAAVNTKGLKKKITRTQRLVEKSVNIVHRFARDLRPTLLDDLGLIPALHAYMKGFTKHTRIPIRFKVFSGVERLNNAKRTVLYRVAQAALTNVAQHAQASLVKVEIQKKHRSVYMAIQDNGKSFDVERVLYAKKNKRLGLLGMRERVEMVGGRFEVKSVKEIGTTIGAQIPFNGTQESF